MKAVVLEAPGKISIMEKSIPEAKDGEALVAIKSVGICGSEVSAYLGRGMKIRYPVTLGHEVAGEIIEVGGNTSGFIAGDRVAIEPYIACQKCYPCSLGRTNCCESLKVLGVQTDGAMSEYFAHPVSLLHHIPDSIPWGLAALAEPLTISLHAIHRTGVKQNEHVVVIGAGPIGILTAYCAQVFGATPIILDLIDQRLEIAKKSGVGYTVNVNYENAVERIAEITNGRMAEVVIEASGSNSAVEKTLEYASYCGRIALTGWPTNETPLMTPTITRKELNIFGSRTSANEFPEAIRFISEELVDAKSIISQTVPFMGLPEGIVNMANHPERYIKIASIL